MGQQNSAVAPVVPELTRSQKRRLIERDLIGIIYANAECAETFGRILAKIESRLARVERKNKITVQN